jgi:hypothetical protein
MTAGLAVTLMTKDRIINELADAIRGDVHRDFVNGETPEEYVEYPDPTKTTNRAMERKFEALRNRIIEIAHGTLDSF